MKQLFNALYQYLVAVLWIKPLTEMMDYHHDRSEAARGLMGSYELRERLAYTPEFKSQYHRKYEQHLRVFEYHRKRANSIALTLSKHL